MEYNIRAYVDELFNNAPRTQKTYELKIELTQNLLDKYHALVEEGKAPQDAYNLTVLSIGDVRELFQGLEEEAVQGQPQYMPPAAPKSNAVIYAVAVMLYILSVVPVIVISLLDDDFMALGLVAMFAMIAAATGLLVYTHMSKPKAVKSAPGTVVGDFKQWQNQGVQKKQILKLIESIFWPLVLAAYFLLSFGTGRWGVTWIIFLIATAIDGIIRAIFTLNDPNVK